MACAGLLGPGSTQVVGDYSGHQQSGPMTASKVACRPPSCRRNGIWFALRHSLSGRVSRKASLSQTGLRARSTTVESGSRAAFSVGARVRRERLARGSLAAFWSRMVLKKGLRRRRLACLSTFSSSILDGNGVTDYNPSRISQFGHAGSMGARLDPAERYRAGVAGWGSRERDGFF
jgi:hypothetical protein